MKKFGFFAAVLMLVAAVMLVAPQPQPAQATPGVSQLCTDNGDFPGFFDNHGDCVSTLQAFFNNGNTDPVFICKFTNNFGGFFKNQGQCVSALRHL